MKKIQLYFDEPTHTYTDEEGTIYTSATTLIAKVSPKFEPGYWTVYKALDQAGYKIRPDNNKQKILLKGDARFDEWKEYTPVYLKDCIDKGVFKIRTSPEDFAAQWKEDCDAACNWGNDRHSYLEDCINTWYKDKKDVDVEYTKNISGGDSLGYKYKIVNEQELKRTPLSITHPTIYALLLSLIEAGFVLYAEKRIYSYDHKVSGTIDVLAFRGKDFYIVDWKTNKDELVFESGYFKKEWNKDRTEKVKTKEWVNNDERFNYPLNSLQYCKGNTYALQLSLYAYLCELWGLTNKGLILCHIRHTKVKDKFTGDMINKELVPRIYKTIKYHKSEIKSLLDWHVNVNLNKQILRPGRGVRL